jgi:D-amino peptidase
VIVRDGHGGGNNVDPALINPRARLIQGPTPGVRFKDIEGSEALILLGYHGMAQTKNALFAHSYSSASIQMMYLNGKPVGEIGVDASIAGEYNIPVVMVSGDDKTVKEAKAWIPGVVTCQVKKGTSHLSGKCLTLNQSHELITKKTMEALKKRNSIKPVKADYPATIRWDYIPDGHPRVYDLKFTPVANPRFVEKSSENSIEQILL